MAYRVTLKPSGHSYEAEEGKNVLQAGLDAGHMLPYSCRAGVCRTCRGTILEGKVDYGLVHDTYLPESDKAKGYALLCQAKPLSRPGASKCARCRACARASSRAASSGWRSPRPTSR